MTLRMSLPFAVHPSLGCLSRGTTARTFAPALTRALAFFAIAFLLASPTGAEMGDILHSIPCAGDNTADLAWGSGELYQVIFSPTEQRNIYRLDPETGDVIGIVPYAGAMPQGITFDGQHLWQVCLTGDCLYEMDPISGEVFSSFDAPGGDDGQPIGLGWDGEWLWLADSRSPEKIWQLDTEGNVHGQYPAPGSSPYGLAWADGFIWVSENNMSGVAVIYKIDAATGDIVGQFNCPGNGGSPNGITHDGEYLWIAVNTNDTIYQVDDGVAGSGIASGEPAPAPLRLITARSHPEQSGIEVRFEVAAAARITAQLFDVTGRQAAAAGIHVADAGPHTLTLTPAPLASGTYYVRLSGLGDVSARPVLIVR